MTIPLNKPTLEKKDVIQACLNWTKRHEKNLFKGMENIPVTIVDYHGLDSVTTCESELKNLNIDKLLKNQASVQQVKIQSGLT